MIARKRIYKYFREYSWSNIFEMIRNNGKSPKVCTEPFKDKLVVITGATSGIGYFTAKKYASMGANLLCINRNKEKSESLKKELEETYGIKCDYQIADLSLLNDIYRVSDYLFKLEKSIDVLIHNAGIYLNKRELTVDGLEKVFVVNYLSSFIINYSLMDKLKTQNYARIILVSSEGYRFAVWGLDLDDLNWEKRKYSGLGSYGQAKLAQILSMHIFNELVKNSKVAINAMHPGAVKSNTGQDNGPIYKWFKRNILDKSLKSPEISAEALYYLGVSKEVEGITGKFFNLTTEESLAPPAKDIEIASKLWEKSLEISGLKA
ncbi:MAG: SDR family NAD(P)-dependent oxidoreductase [Candidatus Parvarchaeota archaeon]|nr:SDR family NAD(P)-dependent oxidoreductase [Candidatus Jingweiarchaeum tengchongense]